MKVSQAEPPKVFAPVTLVLESKEEFWAVYNALYRRSYDGVVIPLKRDVARQMYEAMQPIANSIENS